MRETLPTLIKFFTDDMRSPIGTSEPWEVGQTVRVEGDIVPCENGLHCWPAENVLQLTGPRMGIVTIGDEYVWHGEGNDLKLVAREMTLVRMVDEYNERTLRLFAADCAERVLPIYESRHPDDDRPKRAIEVARLFANGEATREELDAARDAARAAAWGAAWGAARDAARAAARAAERGWRTQRLLTMLGLEVLP